MENLLKGSETQTRVLLASIDTGEFDSEVSIKELEELAETAGASVVTYVIQKRPSPDSATVLGEGKIEEIRQLCESNEIELIIFDTELSSSQIRNIEKITGVRVIDRTMLILDIFAARAVSGEGKLQVELAQHKYRLPRLSGIGASMSRIGGSAKGGGIGTRGPGETQLETDRRHIRRRIAKLSDELAELEARREFSRSRRKKDNVLVGAIVGYTNVGKSTLLNKLTEAGVLAENRLFATLDLTSRGVELPDGRSLTLVDTVGLIRRLPHHLVEAFKSTLEEAANADIILHVCDVSDPETEQKTQTTREILAELGCSGIPVLTVYNKCDKAPDYFIRTDDESVKISAVTGFGLEEMLLKITRLLPESLRKMKLSFPYEKAGLIAQIRKSGKVTCEDFTENGITVEALVDIKLMKEVEMYAVAE